MHDAGPGGHHRRVRHRLLPPAVPPPGDAHLFRAGVQVVEPGCRVVRITPHLGDLEWVEGTFPTPYGVITIRHEKGADGKVRSRIDAPSEVKVVR